MTTSRSTELLTPMLQLIEEVPTSFTGSAEGARASRSSKGVSGGVYRLLDRLSEGPRSARHRRFPAWRGGSSMR